jgi:hypothetical protein
MRLRFRHDPGTVGYLPLYKQNEPPLALRLKPKHLICVCSLLFFQPNRGSSRWDWLRFFWSQLCHI